MKSIYMLSLMEAYAEDENQIPSIIMVEDPEMFLHPKLQKTSSEILYRLSQKNQVIFTTHSPHLLSNFEAVRSGRSFWMMKPIPSQRKEPISGQFWTIWDIMRQIL